MKENAPGFSSVLLAVRPMMGLCLLVLGFTSCQRTSAEEEQLRVLTAVDRAEALVRGDQYQRALHFLDSSYQKQKPLSDFAKVNYYQFMRWAESFVSREHSALRYYDSMYYADRHITDEYPAPYAKYLIERADVYLKEQEFNRAFECLYMARKIASEHKDHQVSHDLYSILGNAMYRQGNFSEAAQNYRKGYFHAKRTGLKVNKERYKRMNGQANNTALGFLKLGLYDSSQYYYELALEAMDSFAVFNKGDQLFYAHGTGVVLSNMAHLELLRGHVDEAIELHKTSIDYNIDSGGVALEGLITVCQLAEIYIEQGNLEEAETLLSHYQGSLDAIANIYLQSEQEKALWKYQLALGDTAQAYHHYLKMMELSEEDHLAKHNLVDLDFEKEMAKYEEHWALRKLQKKSELQQSVLLSMVLLLVAFFLFYTYVRRNHKKLRNLHTQISEQNQRLSLSLESLQRSQEENRRILQVVAHDLRNPIGGFMGLTDALLEKDYLEQEDRELIELIHSSSEEALGFVNELLQDPGGNDNIKKERTNLLWVLEQSVTLQKHRAEAKEVQLKVEKEDVMAVVSPDKMGRVMGNIISNAIKFSHRGSSIEIELKETAKGALFSVKDYGIGIPKSMQATLFDSHSAVEKRRAGTQGEASHGLGLSIVKQLVEAHGGTIWLESEVGKGSVFYVEVPSGEA